MHRLIERQLKLRLACLSPANVVFLFSHSFIAYFEFRAEHVVQRSINWRIQPSKRKKNEKELLTVIRLP